MEIKTFKEVVRDIKKGETWVTAEKGYKLKSISRGEDIGILKFNYSEATRDFSINPNQKFVLDRKSYDFDEAYIELLNGRVIESESENRFVMKDEKIYKIVRTNEFLYRNVECSNIECADILGKWYILGE